jgi:hypothetical protein
MERMYKTVATPQFSNEILTRVPSSPQVIVNSMCPGMDGVLPFVMLT